MPISLLRISQDLSVEDIAQIIVFMIGGLGKQYRGAVGCWHFNNVRVDRSKNIVYLTSRLCSCIVEVDLDNFTASLRTIRWDTPVMLHDGEISKEGDLVFTSVDGKILICNSPQNLTSGVSNLEEEGFHSLMRRDMVNKSIRLGNVLDREINWCRGIADDESFYYTTIDGRYDQDMPYFRIVSVYKMTGEIVDSIKVNYDVLPESSSIRSMTGFSLLL